MWTDKELEHLTKHSNRPKRVLAKQLNRSESAILNKVARLRKEGLLPKAQWSEAEDKHIKDFITSGVERGINKLLPLLPNRTFTAISTRVCNTRKILNQKGGNND
jgi:hypothetical protein